MASEIPSAHTSRRFSSAVALKVILPLVGCLVAMGVVEVVFRLLMNGARSTPPLMDKPKINYMPESAFLTRDFYYPPEKAAGTFRIVAIGDSFTFGGKVQFDDTFPKRLERMLNLNTSQRKVEVLNWGIPGYSTVQEAELFEDAVMKFNPDLIVVEITLNDAELKPFQVTHGFQNKDGSVKVGSSALRHWKSLEFVVTRIYNTILQQEYIEYHQKMFNDPENWKRFSGALKKMKNLSERHSVPMFVVIFPMLSHPLDDTYPFQQVHEKIMKELVQQGIPSRDMFRDFEGRNPVRLQVDPGRDGHPNELGHRIAAESIYMGLTESRLIPEDVQIKRVMTKRWVKPNAVRDAARAMGPSLPAGGEKKEAKSRGDGPPARG